MIAHHLALMLMLAPTYLTAPSSGEINVYLPRSISVESPTLTLGLISVVGGDRNAASRAESVTLGLAPNPGERITFDRNTILSRLVCCGFSAADVRISGADVVSVTRKQELASAEDILRTANALLEKEPLGPDGCTWKAVHPVRDLVIPGNRKATLVARRIPDAPKFHAKVNVLAMDGETELASCEVLVRLNYPVLQVVAVKTIPSGETLTAENTRVETIRSEFPESTPFVPLIGKVATTRLDAGAVIRPDLTRPAVAEIVVRRNQTVIMEIKGDGFRITATGQALQDGRPGDMVKVRNTDSNRIVSARVGADGTVEPLAEEKAS